MLPIKKSVLAAAALIVGSLLLSSCSPAPICSTAYLISSINNANSNGAGTDIINLEAGCVYQLDTVDNTVDGNNGTPSITSSIVINGNGATIRRSTASQKAAIRLFHVSQGGELVLNDIRLYDGVGVEPPDTTLPLRNHGGAIFNAGTLTVNNVDFDYNRARRQGGGIYNIGTMNINTSTFQNNEADYSGDPGGSGGAIWNGGVATINRSTFVNNTASQSGGAIENAFGGVMTITNSTITSNATVLSGLASGAAVMNAGNLVIDYTTITENVGTTSGAVWSAPDTIEILNSIVANNLPQNCSYPASSPTAGPNLDDDGSCDNFTITADPQLDPLASNGGPTQTHAIGPSSPAKNAASSACPALDQRGETRPHGSACDLGSYELVGNQNVPVDPAELSGMVYNDQDGDGVYTPGEPAFAGVELVLGTGTCSSSTPLQTTIAASDGSYQFSIPAPNAGTYCISIDPLVEPNTSILIPGGFTQPSSGEYEITLTEGQDLSNLFFGWMWQFGPNPGPADLEITNVVLSATSIHPNEHVAVEVTITNMGSTSAAGYDVVLIPTYGWGPPNPGGYAAIPELAPGAAHTEIFSPGAIYGSNLGTFTLRILVTDDWYSLGDADSTGTAGDYEDHTITVTANLCDPFQELDVWFYHLDLPGDTRNWPVYLKVDQDFFPGYDPDQNNGEPPAYSATLGEMEAYSISQQGFPQRLYFMFNILEGLEGTDQPFQVWLPDCPEPVYELPAVQIPLPTLICTAELDAEQCKLAGGSYEQIGRTGKYECVCP